MVSAVSLPLPPPRYYITCSRENCSAVNERLNISNHGRVKMYNGRSSRRIIRVKMRRVAGALLARTFPNDYFGTNDSFYVETLIRIFVLTARPTRAQANSINKHHAQKRANHLTNVFVGRQFWDFKSTFFYVSALSKSRSSRDIDRTVINDNRTSSFMPRCSVVCSHRTENNYW